MKKEIWIHKLSEDCFLKRIEPLDAVSRRQLLLARMYSDAEFFARQVLPEHCRLPFAPLHRLLFGWHREMGRGEIPGRRGRRYVLAAPRGSAKSTVASLALVLHDVLFAREQYIVLLSATERQARQRLRAVRNELQRGAVRNIGFKFPTRCTYTAASVCFGGVRIDAYGAGTEIRGITSEGFRPTKIILDDAEASSAADSLRARERLADWFSEIVEHLGDVYTHMLAIGTVLHEKGLIATLLRRPDFTGHLARSIERFSTREDLWSEWRRRLMDFSDSRRRDAARYFFSENRAAMESGTEVLWKEKEDYEDLLAQLTLQGRRAFYQEKQNTPLGAEDSLFDPLRVLRAVYTGGVLEVVARDGERTIPVRRYPNAAQEGRRFGYLDAALGKGRKSGRGDFAVLASVMLLPDGSLVLEDLWARRAAPSEQVARLFDRHEAAPFEVLGIEGTGFQELMAVLVEEERRARRNARRAADVPVRVIHPKKAKPARISGLEPLLTNGTLALSSSLDEEFWEELANYPRTPHDDALDAAAGAVALALSRPDVAGEDWSANGKRTSRGLRWM